MSFVRYYPRRNVKQYFTLEQATRGPGQLSRYIDSLRSGLSGDRMPVGARFSAPAPTGHGTHPASYTMGTGSSPEVTRPGHGVTHCTSASPLGLRGLF